MPTLEGLEAAVATALTTAGYTVSSTWSGPTSELAAGGNALVLVANTELLDGGSNIQIRTAEVVTTVATLAADMTSSALAAAEALANQYLEELTAASFWSAVAGVRNSPLPEVDLEDEPERIGRVITFGLRARMALES